MCVLLSDEGVAASERALNTYCALHRLLIALVDKYNLQDAVENRLAAFIESPNARHKVILPTLYMIVFPVHGNRLKPFSRVILVT